MSVQQQLGVRRADPPDARRPAHRRDVAEAADGPVGIAQLSGESAQVGWIALLRLMASISLNLGLLNLLPIPVLDGGHIFIMALEGVARRDFSMRVKEQMLFAGFVLLMLLMVTVIYNDLTRIQLGREPDVLAVGRLRSRCLRPDGGCQVCAPEPRPARARSQHRAPSTFNPLPSCISCPALVR